MYVIIISFYHHGERIKTLILYVRYINQNKIKTKFGFTTLGLLETRSDGAQKIIRRQVDIVGRSRHLNANCGKVTEYFVGRRETAYAILVLDKLNS